MLEDIKFKDLYEYSRSWSKEYGFVITITNKSESLWDKEAQRLGWNCFSKKIVT